MYTRQSHHAAASEEGVPPKSVASGASALLDRCLAPFRRAPHATRATRSVTAPTLFFQEPTQRNCAQWGDDYPQIKRPLPASQTRVAASKLTASACQESQDVDFGSTRNMGVDSFLEHIDEYLSVGDYAFAIELLKERLAEDPKIVYWDRLLETLRCSGRHEQLATWADAFYAWLIDYCPQAINRNPRAGDKRRINRVLVQQLAMAELEGIRNPGKCGKAVVLRSSEVWPVGPAIDALPVSCDLSQQHRSAS